MMHAEYVIASGHELAGLDALGGYVIAIAIVALFVFALLVWALVAMSRRAKRKPEPPVIPRAKAKRVDRERT